MIEVKDLISSLRNVLFKEEYRKTKISSIIENITSIKIKTEDIEIKNSVIFLNIKPIFKNEIFLKKEKILSNLKDDFKDRIPTDIR